MQHTRRLFLYGAAAVVAMGAVAGLIVGSFVFAAIEGLLAIALLLVGLRLGRPMEVTLDAPPRVDRRPPVAPVGDADLDALMEPVTACPDCGFLGIRPLGLRDGGVPGVSEIGAKQNCPRCGYQGLAISFDSREDYGAFLRELSGGATRAA